MLVFSSSFIVIIDVFNLFCFSFMKAKYLTRKMTATSVEAMHSIDELFDKIAVRSF